MMPPIAISIHAPHARSDVSLAEYDKGQAISIHAPHARSDQRKLEEWAEAGDFNPRSSCEERLCMLTLGKRYPLFQSTLLMRGATI